MYHSSNFRSDHLCQLPNCLPLHSSFFPPSGVIFNFSETSSFYSVPFLLASCLLIQQLLISRICLKTRHEKGQPLQPICYCIKTWNLSMITGQVHDGALTDWIISCTRRKNAWREHLFFLHHVKIQVEKWNYRLISVLAPTCVMVHHTATHHQLVAWHGNYTVSNILRVPCRRHLFTKKKNPKKPLTIIIGSNCLIIFKVINLLLPATHRNGVTDEVLSKWMNNFGFHSAENQ